MTPMAAPRALWAARSTKSPLESLPDTKNLKVSSLLSPFLLKSNPISQDKKTIIQLVHIINLTTRLPAGFPELCDPLGVPDLLHDPALEQHVGVGEQVGLGQGPGARRAVSHPGESRARGLPT